jgi:CheY-like chemotaxis protein
MSLLQNLNNNNNYKDILNIDLIITDINMPFIDGYTFAT